MKAKTRSWLVGLALAAIGVVLVRLVADAVPAPALKLLAYSAGILAALAGLGFIGHGIRKG